MVRERDEGGGVGEESSAAAAGKLDRAAASTEPLPNSSMVNVEWGKAACTEESIEKWTAADVFRPGELVEWRAPAKDEAPSPSTLKDQYVILSLTHIMCGLRTDASDFLISVLKHYCIEWSHLTPNSITALSIFVHLCEAYLGVLPTVELFAHFYKLYANNKRETVTLGGVYFRLRDKKKGSYPVYYLKASQFVWTCLWFYAKLPQNCRLTFKCDVLKETNNWKDVVFLSPEQEKQVLQIEELSNQGLTGADIIHDYLKHRISPLRRRAHLACNYTGPTDPTRDSDKDLSEEDIESQVSYLLDLKKTAQKEPSRGPNVPTSLIRASADERANEHVDLQHVLLTLKTKTKRVDELTAPRMTRKSSAYKPLVPASPRRYTRQSAVPRKTVVPAPPEIDPSPVGDHSDLEDEELLEVRTPKTTAASANQGVKKKSIENPAEIEEGKRVALVKPISSIIDGKRKFFTSPSDSHKKTKMSPLNTGRLKGTSSRKETAAALNPQSPGSARLSPALSVEKGEKGALFILANVVNQNKVAEDSVSNVPPDQDFRDSPLKEVVPAQSIALIPVSNPEEINSEVIWERMQKVQSEFASFSEATLSELLEQAKKLIIKNKRLKDEHIMLEQQVKDLKENRKLLEDTIWKAEQDASKRMEENGNMKDEIRDQKKMIVELREQNESTQASLGQKCAEVNRLREDVAALKKGKEELMKDKEALTKDKVELESRVSRANELLKLMTNALHHEKGEDASHLAINLPIPSP